MDRGYFRHGYKVRVMEGEVKAHKLIKDIEIYERKLGYCINHSNTIDILKIYIY